jgi:hypothetical protein
MVFLMSLTGCSSIATEMLAPMANFAIGFYDHDDYYSKECLWYDEVKLNEETKKWFMENTPPEVVTKDLATVSRNNDIYKEVCETEQGVLDKVQNKVRRLSDE